MGSSTDLLVEIYQGWKNYIFDNPDVKLEAERRIAICVYCDKLRKLTKTCSLCGCYMPAKTKNLKSKCKINKW
jgi:hypothetical protein